MTSWDTIKIKKKKEKGRKKKSTAISKVNKKKTKDTVYGVYPERYVISYSYK